jgi:hypothetical protein
MTAPLRTIPRQTWYPSIHAGVFRFARNKSTPPRRAMKIKRVAVIAKNLRMDWPVLRYATTAFRTATLAITLQSASETFFSVHWHLIHFHLEGSRRRGVNTVKTPIITQPTISVAKSFADTGVPQVLMKRCWVDALVLPQGRDEKQNDQPNTVSVEHLAPDLQFYSSPRAGPHQARYEQGWWGLGQVFQVDSWEAS